MKKEYADGGDKMINRMRKALLEWCNSYQTAVSKGGDTKAIVKDFFLKAYRLTTNDHFFDGLPPEFFGVSATMEVTKIITTKKQCQTCAWCVKPPVLSESEYLTFKRIFGFCHRHAPVRVEGSGITPFQWPNVEAEAWCGDWMDKNDKGYPDTPTVFENSELWHENNDSKVFDPMAED